MATVLFVTYGGGHVNMVIPVARSLLEQGVQVQVLGLTTAGAALERAGIPSLGFRDLVMPGDTAALARGERLAAGLPPGSVPYEETVAYLGLSYADLEARLGAEEAERRYASEGRRCFLPLTVMARALDLLQPDLVVATNSPRAERAAIMAASAKGIPALCLVDLFATQEIAWIGEPGYADRVCVLTESVRRRVIERGRRPGEVVVTGNPAFDRLAMPGVVKRARAFRAERAWGQRRVVLWASQPEPERHPFTGATGDPSLPRRIEQTLMAMLRAHPDWQLVIRPHPSENLQFPELLPRVAISTQDDDLAVLLQAVDVVVTMTSTVGLEAALLGKPVVAVGLSVSRDDAPYASLGLARGVEQLDELEAALIETLDGRWQPAAGLPLVGQATANVVREIQAMLKSG